MSKFEVFGTRNGGYAWRLKAINGEILCHSEVFTSKQAAINGINAVKRLAPFSRAYDLT
jgi:uncharacterized protein